MIDWVSQAGRRWNVGREGTPVLKVVQEASAGQGSAAASGSLIDEIVADGARRMLAAALEAEVASYVDQFVGELDENGRRLVVGTAGRSRGR